MPRVLIVDGETAVRRFLNTILNSRLHAVTEAESPAEAAQKLESREVDVLLAESRLDGGHESLLSAARRADPNLSVVLVTERAVGPSAPVEGPGDLVEIVPKPLHASALQAAVARAAERCRLRRENASLQDQVRELREALDRTVQSPGEGDGEIAAPPANGNGNGNGGDYGADAGLVFEAWIASLPESLNLRSLEADVEREIVKRALAASSGVAAQAARKLGLSRSDLAYKLRRLGIAREPR